MGIKIKEEINLELKSEERIALILNNNGEEHFIYLINTPEGFIVDVYKKDDEGGEYNVCSNTVWDED